MSEQEKLQRGKRRTKIILITVTVLFIVLMLVVPLISVITSALKEGFKFYLQRQAGAGDTDRHSVFHITCHRRPCLPHDIWKTWMDVSGDQMDQ